VARVGTGRRLLIASSQVRFLPPELWPSCIGFRNLIVNQVHVGSIPSGHPAMKAALESIWWWNLTVDQVVASSILVGGAVEGIRLDEETVLKTVGGHTASGFESLVFRLGPISAWCGACLQNMLV